MSRERWTRPALFVAVAAAIGLGLVTFGDQLDPTSLARREDEFRTLERQRPWLVTLGIFSAYVVVTGLSLPGATALTLFSAWLLGFWRALVVVSFASTLGAVLAFLLSRYLLRDFVRRRFGDRLRAFNDALEREGALYLFTLRLIPAAPFFVVNLVMGLTPMKTRTYWWVSQLGMLPGTIAYVYAGSQLPSLRDVVDGGAGKLVSPAVLSAFVVIGLLPLVVKRVVERVRVARSRRV